MYHMKTILLSISVLIGMTASSQNLEWQWAKRGGGTKSSADESENSFGYESEQIIDIAIDADNNYYFLAFMAQDHTEFDGTPVTVYNTDVMAAGFTDIVLISTDCSGELRWTQTIGGADRDFAYKIVLDNNGGLYLGASVINISGPGQPYLPPHFSPGDSMPVLGDFGNGESQPGYKTLALLKYNTADGSLAWRVMPQGDVTPYLRYGNINEVVLDSQGVLHVLLGFYVGSHLNGQITVPDTFTNKYQYHLVKFDTDGNFISTMPLPLEGKLLQSHTDFRYDEVLGRYYLAGFRNNGGTDPLVDLSFNEVPFVQQAYILAFGTSGNEIWRREVSSSSSFKDTQFHDIEIDGDSNIYLCGRYLLDPASPNVSMNGYQFPNDIGANLAFVMKMNADGNVLWFRKPSGYTTNFGIYTGMAICHDLVVNGDEIAVATQVSNEIWGSIAINRPVNHKSDPGILRLDKATGTPIAVNDIMGYPNYDDAFTSVTVDNGGNYVAGGYFHYTIFTAPDDNIPTLTKVLGQDIFTDFFITKLGANPCGELGKEDLVKNEIRVYPNPTNDIVNIQTDEQLVGYQVSNMIGQVVLKGNLLDKENSVDISSLKSGTYIIKFDTIEGTVISQKIIKK